jgi:hypothetical protein
VLTLWAGQPECLWDEALPIEVRELPQELAALDGLLADPELAMVFLERFRREVVETGRLVLTEGRPTIAMETYVRLMVLKARYRWGYRTLVAEVSDSIHLRRFCRISLSERVPDESTIRKLTRPQSTLSSPQTALFRHRQSPKSASQRLSLSTGRRSGPGEHV